MLVAACRPSSIDGRHLAPGTSHLAIVYEFYDCGRTRHWRRPESAL